MTVSIIGSCVTRDTLEVVDGLDIGPYVARTSLASIVSPPSRRMRSLELNYTEQARPWHRRVATADLHKTHDEQLRQMAGGHVVIDLIEERVDLVRVGWRRYVTRSQILSAMSDFDRHVNGAVRIFSTEGFAIWKRSLPKFARMLGRYVPEERTIIHRALYAPGARAIADENDYLDRMYDELAAAMPRARLVSPSAAVFRASAHHKWGPAPFHYVDEYYREMAAKILAECGLARPFKAGFTFQADPASASTR